MKLHSEKVIHHKSEIDFLPETAISLPNQSDDDYQASKNDEWSSSDEHSTWDKGNLFTFIFQSIEIINM
jgi:hypothetical protein